MLLILTRLIGIVIAGMGLVFFLRPKALEPYTMFWQEKKRLYFIGGSRILMGTIVLLSAAQCRNKVVAIALGILFIIAGIPYFILKLDKQKAMVSRWRNRPAKVVRILGLLILAFGALLLYSA